jgi:hypothetical protein
MSKEENVLDKYRLMAEIISMDEPTEITNLIKVKNARIELAYEKCKEIAKEYANIRLKAQESESQKLYEWMLSNKIEPAQTHFSSGVIRNIAKEIEFREEKHKEEMEKFFYWTYVNGWTHSVTPNFFIRIEYPDIVVEKVSFTELIEMFKKSITANG